MYDKTLQSFGFCDIQNNQGLGKGLFWISQKSHIPIIVSYCLRNYDIIKILLLGDNTLLLKKM